MLPRLKELIAARPSNVVILSPYLTSDAADDVVGLCEAATCRVYTDFSAELFVAGASDLRTLRNLRRTGCALFHLPRLHAKVYLGEDFAVVGSQYLTRRGDRTNREASAVVRDPRELALFRSRLAGWLELALLITDEAFAAMEAFVASARPDFEARRRAWEAHDRETQTLLRLARPVEFANGAAVASLAVKFAEIRTMPIFDRWGDDTFRTYATLKLARGSFLDWRFPRRPSEDTEGTRTVTFSPRDRRLVVSLDTNRMAWVAMNKGQLTQFGEGVIRTDAAPDSTDVAVDEINLNDAPAGNVRFEVRLSGRRARVNGRFDGERLDLALDAANPAPTVEARRLFAARRRELEDSLLRLMLAPFRYDRNRTGTAATTFLDAEPGVGFEVGCREASQGPYLTVRRRA